MTCASRARRWSVFALLLLVTGAAPGQAVSPGPISKDHDEAGRLSEAGIGDLARGQWDEAIRKFQKAMQFGGADGLLADRVAEAQTRKSYAQGLRAFEQGNLAAAQNHFDATLQFAARIRDKAVRQTLTAVLDDTNSMVSRVRAELLLQAGMDQFNRGDFASARSVFEQVLKIDAGNQWVHTPSSPWKRASDQLVTLKNEEVLRKLNEAVRLGNEDLARGNLREALQRFQDAQRLNPNDERALKGERQAARNLQVRQRKLAILIAVLAGPSVFVLVMMASGLRRARLYTRLGRFRPAAAVYEKLLTRNPARVQALLALAALYRRTGQPDRALDFCSQYLRLRPDDRRILALAGRFYFEKADYSQAAAMYHRILQTGRGDKEVYLALLELSNHLPATIEPSLDLCLKALRHDPDSPELNRLAGKLLLASSRTDPEATEVYRRAVLYEPDNVPLRWALAQAYWAQDRFADTAKEAMQILGPEPNNASALALFLRASHSNRSLDSALAAIDSGKPPLLTLLTAYESAVDLDPEYRPAAHHRYQALLDATVEGTLEQHLLLAHLALDGQQPDDANEYLRRAYEHLPAAADCIPELSRAHRRLLALAHWTDSNLASRADLIFRLAELDRLRGNWLGALEYFRQIAAFPEWKVRSASVIEDILQKLPLHTVAALFFQYLHWHVADCPDGHEGTDTSRDVGDLWVYPPQPLDYKSITSIERARVRCFERPIVLDDIIQLKGDLAARHSMNDSFAFVVTPVRPRQDVCALIYALMSQEPAAQVIPLEAAVVKQALIQLNCSDTLDQILRLWTGQGDLFDVHSPIADAGTFFGRGRYLHQLTQKILRGENFGLFGLRKIGKTSLVFQLRETLVGTLVGYVDLQSVSSGRCEEIYVRLCEALYRDFRLKYPAVIPPVRTLESYDSSMKLAEVAAAFHHDLLQLRSALEEAGSTPKILLLLDEIELLVPRDNNRGFAGFDDLLRHVRGLFQQERCIVSAVVGADPALCRTGTWGDRDNPVFQYYDEVFLAPLERAECDQMVNGIGEVMGVSFEARSLERIYDESGGHPYVARQLCSRIATHNPRRPVRVSEAMVCDGLDDYLAERPDYFVGVFRGYLSSEARRILEAVATSEENAVDRKHFVGLNANVKMDPIAAEKALQDLELYHLLVRERDSYRIKINLLRRWIRRSWLGIE